MVSAGERGARAGAGLISPVDRAMSELRSADGPFDFAQGKLGEPPPH